MKKIAILSSGIIPLPKSSKISKNTVINGKSYDTLDKCFNASSHGIRFWEITNFLHNENFQVTLFIPDINFPNEDDIDKENLPFKIAKYSYNAAKDSWSEELDRKLLKFDFVILSTTNNVGFKNCSMLPSKIHVIVDGYDVSLTKYSLSTTTKIRVQKKVYWESFIDSYKELLLRSNCVLYSNNQQKSFYEGFFYSIDKLNWRAYKFSTLLKIPSGVYTNNTINEKSDESKLLWFGNIYPWYSPYNLLEVTNKLNIKIDFVGIKSSHIDFYGKKFIDYYNKNIDVYKNVSVIPHYINLNEHLKNNKYTAGVVITENFIENDYASRYRILTMLSHKIPVVADTNIMDEYKEINKSFIKVNTDYDLLEALDNISYPNKEFTDFISNNKWSNILKPLKNYISNFSEK